MVGDPHLDNSLPSSWYQFKASYKNKGKQIEFAGVTLAGTPAVYGQSAYASVAITTIYTDTQDLYREKIKDDYYMVDNLWRDLSKLQETILVKTSNGIQKINHTVRMTHRGPILSYYVSGLGTLDLTEETLSVSWTGYTQGHSSLIGLTYSQELDNFEAVKAHFIHSVPETPSLSILVSTVDNHICYVQLGNNPIRPNYDAGSFIKDGTTTEHDWKGLMPNEDKIWLCDPERGYFVAANNQVASEVAHGGYFKNTIFTARADRLEKLITDEIKSGRKITPQFANKLLYDTTDSYCQRILP
jgi:penicillin G amidase